MPMTAAELDETARIILLDEPSGPKEFFDALRAEVPDVSIPDGMGLWSKYRGMDGRVWPTHDIATGRRIPMR